jgi:hypothetical protein
VANELASILSGAPAPKATPKKVYDPFDAAVRTIIAEEADPTAQEWVAGVIANRAKSSGKNFYEVVTAPGQFEPWKRGTAQAVDPASDTYKKTAERVRDILDGKRDPSGGAMNFYAPEAQAELAKKDGRPVKPDFDDGTGVRVGNTLFFKGSSGAPNELASLLGGSVGEAVMTDEQAAAVQANDYGDPTRYDKAQFAGAGTVPFEGRPETLNKAQTKTYEMLAKGSALDPKQPKGTPRNPLWVVEGYSSERDVPPGAYYVDQKGAVKRAEGGEEEDQKLKEGFSRGVGDVLLSGLQLYPAGEDSFFRNRMEADQALYDADLKGDVRAGIGRFTGQLAATALPVVGVEAGAASVGGGLGRFLIGQGGKQMAPGAAKLATRAASLGTAGALEGAAASALTSSAGEGSLPEQIATGAALGGVLRPAAGAVSSGVSRLIGGRPLEGAAALSEQQALHDMAQGLPVKVPLSRGQLTGAPGAQLEENAILKGVSGDPAAKVVQGFKAEQQEALRANTSAIANLIAGKPTAQGEGAKAVSETLNVRYDAAKKAIDDAYDAARARGEDAMLATAHDVREGTLEGLRRNFGLEAIPKVAKQVEAWGEGGSPTVRQIFDARTRLVNLQGEGGVEGKAAGEAKKALDAYMDTALKNDLLLGDPEAVKAWREAIGKRAEFGRLFEGDDLIEGLTERVSRGGGRTLAVDPEEAANYILNRSNLGWVGKKNLGRDLKRLETVLGKDSEEWNGLRAEAFLRLAKAGEGVAESGAPQFSGQKFMSAWEKAKRDDPHILGVLFTPEERATIDKLAKVAQIATTPVRGGDNPSGTSFAAAKLLKPLANFLSVGGGAAAGGAAGGPGGSAIGALFGAMLKDVGEMLAVRKAGKITYGAKPVDPPRLQNSLIPGSLLPAAAAITAN